MFNVIALYDITVLSVFVLIILVAGNSLVYFSYHVTSCHVMVCSWDVASGLLSLEMILYNV